MAGTVTTTDLMYDREGRVIREVVTTRDIASERVTLNIPKGDVTNGVSTSYTPFVPVKADEFIYRVHVTRESDAWDMAEKVSRAIESAVRNSRYRGAEIKITRG